MKPIRHIGKQRGKGKGEYLPALEPNTGATRRDGLMPSSISQQFPVNSTSSLACKNIEILLLPLGAIVVTVDLSTRRFFVPTEFRENSADLTAIFNAQWLVVPDGAENLVAVPLEIAQDLLTYLHDKMCIEKGLSENTFRSKILDLKSGLRLDSKKRWQLTMRQVRSMGLDKAPTNDDGNTEIVLCPFQYHIDFIRKDIYDQQQQEADKEIDEKLKRSSFPTASRPPQISHSRPLSAASNIVDTGGANNTKGTSKEKTKG